MDPNSAVIHAKCRKELASQREDYEMTISALMHQRTQLRKEKDSVTQQRNTLEAALDKSRSDIDRVRHERDSFQQTEKSFRAKSKNEISRLREAVSSIQADRDQSQIEYNRQNKRVLSLTQDNNSLSQQLQSQADDIQRREQEADILICQLDKAQRASEELVKDKGECEESRRMLEGELCGLRQGLQDTLKCQIDAISQAAESADYRQKERLRSVTRELSRVLESVVTSSPSSSDTYSSYSVTASRDGISGSGTVLGGQIDLRSLLEEVQQRGKGSSLSIGTASRSRSSSLTGSEKKITERLNTELCRFKEQKDSLSLKVGDLKAENQSISEKLLRENRQNEIQRAEIQELQRRYEQSVSRLEKKEQETIRLNEELDRIKDEKDCRGNVDITAFERENPFSGHLSSRWSQDVTYCVHDENSFTMVSELTDPTLAGLSTLAVNDTNVVLQAQIDETITSNLPPRIVPYSVQGPSPELGMDEPVPQESLQSAVSRLKEERKHLEQKLQSAELENSDLRVKLSQACERRPASQLFERVSQMEAEKEKLMTENNQLRDEIRYRCPSGGGLQEKNQHLSVKLVEAVRLLENNNKEKRTLTLNLFGPEANTATTMSDVTRRVDEILSEKQALATAVDMLSAQLRSVQDEADGYQTVESLRGEVAVLKERVLTAETDNVELTQHLADMVRERDTRQQTVTQTETVCRELKFQNEKLTLLKAQLEAEHEEVSAELLLARDGYRQVVEERDNLSLQNEQIMAQYQDAIDCKERVVEEHAVTLAQMDGIWRLKTDLEVPRSHTPTHIWGEGWDRKTLVLQLYPKKDPDIYLAGGKGQPLLPNPNAVIVVDVLPSSPACHLLQPGDVIESIDGCDCSILTKTEVIGKMLQSSNSCPEVVLLRRRGPYKLLVIPDVSKPSVNRTQRSSSRNQLSASASFPGSRSPCLTPEPSDFLLDSKISQVSLTSSLTSHTDIQKFVNRASNLLMNSQLRTEQKDIVLLANKDSKRGFGFSYSWESQFIVSALTKTGAASTQLTPGDKIVKVNGVSVLQAKPSSVKRLIRNNKNVLKLSIVRSVIPGSSNTQLLNQDIFSDTEAIENPILQKKASLLAQEKDYYSAGESKTEEKGFIRNRLSLMRSKKRRKSNLPVPVESDSEDPHPPSGPVSALSKIKAVRAMRLRKKQSSLRDDLEPHREESGEDRKTYEDVRHPLHGVAVEKVFEERKVDCPTPPTYPLGPAAQETTPQTSVEIQSHTPTQLELSCEEDRVNSPGFLLARDASGRTTFRNLPDLDRKLANKRHSLTSAPVINCSASESTEAIHLEFVSRSVEMFVLKNEHSQLSGSVGETILAAPEHHRPQSELGLESDKTTFPPFRSISPISLQRSLTEKKTADHLSGESSAIDSFLDEARALISPEQQVPVPGWQDTPPLPEFIRANFTIQGHHFLTVTEGAVYQILETAPSQLTEFMLVAPVFPEEMHVKEGYIPTENTGKEMLQNLKPSLDLRRLKMYSPVKLYHGPRPVLIFGPLSGEIGQQLEKAYNPEFVVCPKAFVRANDEQMKDQLCNDIAKGLILDLTANSQKSYMFFELDYIQLQIADGKHSILNSSPKIIGQLKEKGIPPISILIKARTANTILSFSSRNLTEKDCTQMFQAFENIEVDLEPNLHAALNLVKMPVLVEQLREVIQREQNLPVWMNV